MKYLSAGTPAADTKILFFFKYNIPATSVILSAIVVSVILSAIATSVILSAIATSVILSAIAASVILSEAKDLHCALFSDKGTGGGGAVVTEGGADVLITVSGSIILVTIAALSGSIAPRIDPLASDPHFSSILATR